MTPLLLAAAVAEPVADSTAVLLAYGPLGVFAIISIISGRVIWKRFSELLVAATARAESAEAKNDLLVEKMLEQVNAIVPVLTRSTDATAEMLAELAAARRERR